MAAQLRDLCPEDENYLNLLRDVCLGTEIRLGRTTDSQFWTEFSREFTDRVGRPVSSSQCIHWCEIHQRMYQALMVSREQNAIFVNLHHPNIANAQYQDLLIQIFTPRMNPVLPQHQSDALQSGAKMVNKSAAKDKIDSQIKHILFTLSAAPPGGGGHLTPQQIRALLNRFNRDKSYYLRTLIVEKQTRAARLQFIQDFLL